MIEETCGPVYYLRERKNSIMHGPFRIESDAVDFARQRANERGVFIDVVKLTEDLHVILKHTIGPSANYQQEI
jgi:hypothetical protein